MLGSQQTAEYGSAKVNLVGSDAIVATVQVRGGTPNAEYGVRIIQVPEDVTGDCETFEGPFEVAMRTDDEGTGTLRVREPALAGASGVFVVLNETSDPGRVFLTTPVTSL